MAECACDCGLLGREPVRGGANADGLAALVRLVTRRARAASPAAHATAAADRRYRLRCSKEGLELRAARRQEDEGFESDDDAVSQASSDSNGSSCCGGAPGDERDGRGRGPPAGARQNSADSANGSGASDNDDDPRTTKKREDSRARELYAFNDVAFCHTDPAFPRVLVLVIKRKKSDADPSTGLEAVIFQCKSAENVREVCASYKEFSRRLKMDLQFRYPHRRKDAENANTLYKNAVNELQKANAGAPPADSPFLKTWITRVASEPQRIASEPDYRAADGGGGKYNLVQRTDDDGVTHIEVSKSALGDYVDSTIAADEYSGSSSIISISTPDDGSLVVSSGAANAAPPDAAAGAGGEIEAVIRADVDSSHAKETKTTRPDAGGPDAPPQRPQRGVKKNAAKQKGTRETEAKSKPAKEDARTQPEPEHVKPGTHERVVRGQFVRVNVEQRPASQARAQQRAGLRIFGSGGDLRPGASLSYPAWHDGAPRPRAARSRQAGGERERRGERRSRSGGPAAGRYAEPLPPPPPPQPAAANRPLTNRFFGKLKEIANMNGAYVPTLSRRRNSSGDLAATAQFYQYLEPPVNSTKGSSNLKSVIKKKNCGDNMEPKKVTFSAYATVQVVD